MLSMNISYQNPPLTPSRSSMANEDYCLLNDISAMYITDLYPRPIHHGSTQETYQLAQKELYMNQG